MGTVMAKKKRGGGEHKAPRRQVALPKDVVDAVERCAEKHERPLTWEIARVLRWYVNNGCQLPEGDGDDQD
jgi:hypothetical protein